MKTLRLLLLLIIFCCAFNTSSAQYVTIPDTAFASYLLTNYPACMNGNQMDTTCAGIVRTKTLSCAFKGIRSLSGVQYFDSLTQLDCGSNAIATLPVLPSSLKYLIIQYNLLTSLIGLHNNILIIDADSNLLTTLPVLPTNLLALSVDNNQLNSLPSLTTGLQILSCNKNFISQLPPIPSIVREISADYNLLDSLPSLPPNLQILQCRGNNLTALPALPQTIKKLDCAENNFSTLSILPPLLTHIYCQGNFLTSLPVLPSAIEYLDCSHNQLDSLPGLPTSLKVLYAHNNRLISLPNLPVVLESLSCDDNLLTSLPELNDSLRVFSCTNNPNLHCLPQLNYIQYLWFDSARVRCLPNYGNVLGGYPPVTSVPLCQPGNANGCISNWNVAGAVFNDTTTDCAKQFGEDNVAFLKVQLLQNNNVVQQAYTGSYGVYSFLADTGNYTLTVDTTGLPFNILCPVSQYDSAAVDSGSLLNDKDFALQCKPGYDVAAFSVASNYLFRPAAYVPLKIHAGDNALQWRQRCNTTNLPGQLITTLSGPATYKTPAPGALTPTSVTGNVLTYTITNWSGVNAFTDFNIVVQIDTSAQAGQQVCIDVQLTPTASDNDVANNQLTHCFNVVASYDPNIKEVYPASSVDIAGSHWLTYTVHFQNTGNSYAEHVFVTDTLDTDVDAETFQLLSYSFAPEVTLKGNAVRFNFYHIMLIDSTTDEPNSHGYVQYKVKVKDNATVGTVINNTAFIYFDFNAPVLTNTTTNTITQVTGITSLSNPTATMQLYPNPASDVVLINLSDNLTGGTLTLSDVTGRALTTIPLTAAHNQVNTAELSSGVYLVTAVKGGVRVVKRLVVSR